MNKISKQNPPITFTICIPCYNSLREGHDVFRRCLDSALQQQYPSGLITVLALNDGSTDGTLDILKEYQNNYGKVKFHIINRKNKGLATTRIELIQNVKTQYLLFLENDDVLPPDTILQYAKYINQSPNLAIDVLASKAYEVEKNKVSVNFHVRIDETITDTYEYMQKANFFWNYWSKCYSTKFLHSLDFQYLLEYTSYYVDDLMFMSLIFMNVRSFIFVPFFGYKYFIYKHSLSHDKHAQ
jgi:glycosyltransferase involved in cell wall biosynthesis